MHTGELETSLMLHAYPELVRPGYRSADHEAVDRRALLTFGMRDYTCSGVIGTPSLASPDNGEALLTALVDLACALVHGLRSNGDPPRQ